MEKLKQTLSWFILTHLGRIILAFIWASFWLKLYEESNKEVYLWMSLPGLVYFVVLITIFSLVGIFRGLKLLWIKWF